MYATSSSVALDVPAISLPSKRSLSDTCPVDSRDSTSDIVRMSRNENLPVPECMGDSTGVEEPVRMN